MADGAPKPRDPVSALTRLRFWLKNLRYRPTSWAVRYLCWQLRRDPGLDRAWRSSIIVHLLQFLPLADAEKAADRLMLILFATPRK